MRVINNPIIYVCDSFVNDYKKAALEITAKAITIKSFPCMCCDRSKIKIANELIFSNEDEKIVLCGNNCPFLKKIKNNIDSGMVIKTNDYCFHHFVDQKLIEYIIEKGGYIVTSGWLKSWKSRLKTDGFDQKTARRFYGEFCNEIVYLDTHTEDGCIQLLEEFSDYINIPYRIIDVGLDLLKLYLDQIIKEWQINGKKGYLSDINILRKEKAEYEMVIKIIEQITGLIQKRAIIEKIRELFKLVFGAQEIEYVESGDLYEELNQELNKRDKLIYIDDYEKIIIIRLGTQVRCFGIMKIDKFISPESINRYSSLVKSIIKVSSLAIDNAIQYEMIEKSRDEVAYISNHDVLTNLYNRNFFNKYIEKKYIKDDLGIFVCDIDGLKIVNDNLGHIVGDELIKGAGYVLQHSFRETDIVCRVGGDEFYIIMNECTEIEMQRVKQRLENIISEYNERNSEREYKLSISIGICHSSELYNEKTWENMINIADERMYFEKGKRKRKNNN